MWTCPKCAARVDPGYAACWRCGTSPEGVEDPRFASEAVGELGAGAAIGWSCPKCGEFVDPGFDVCWSCGTSREGVEDPNFVRADDSVPEPVPTIEDHAIDPAVSPVRCPRCRGAMEEGFIRDVARNDQRPSEWVAGAPEWSIWVGLKTGGKERHRVQTFRCVECGYLESYAREGPWSSQ